VPHCASDNIEYRPNLYKCGSHLVKFAVPQHYEEIVARYSL